MNLLEGFQDLSTPLVADACLRRRSPFRVAGPGLRAVSPGAVLAGPVHPVRHFGSVDVFLEAFEEAPAGGVLVVDNRGRLDEGCIGDLTVLEARLAGLAGVFVWGAHRDTAELRAVGVPVFSYGSCPVGPLRLRPRRGDALRSAQVEDFLVDPSWSVFADDDGALFVPLAAAEEVLATAREIRETERRQAEELAAGRSLREQVRFQEYLERRAQDPDWTFRDHLREIGGAIEE